MRLEFESTVSSPVVAENNFTDSTDINSLLRQGVAAAQSGDRPMARTLLSRVTDADPNCVDAWLWLASISEYPEELLVFLKRVLDIEPENERALAWETATRSLLAKTHVQRGAIAAEEGNRDFAMQCFDEAIANDEKCESAWYWKATLTEDDARKLELFARVLSIDPDREDAKDAVRVIEQSRASAQMHEAKKAASEGDLETAANLLSEINAAEPENCEAWVLRAHIARSLEEQFDAYERILQIDPSNAFAQYGHNFLAELAESVRPIEAVEEEVSVEPPFAPEPAPAMSEFEAPAVQESIESEPEHDMVPTSFFEGDAEDHSLVQEDQASVDVWSEPVVEFEASEELNADGSNDADEIVQDLAVPAEQPEMGFDQTNFVEAASLDAVNSIDQYAEVEREEAPLSMVAEEAAREADQYASPTAETMEFRADEHEIEEIVADEVPSEMIDVTDAPSFEDEAAAFAPASPWDAPSSEESSVQFETAADQQPSFEPAAAETTNGCPFCESPIDRQGFSCSSCNAVLSLSDLESLLADNSVNFDAIQGSVARMEAEWNSREFSGDELKMLGIGQFNLRNFDLGFAYIQEAYRKDPNDVILAGQVNALAIRLDEIRRQNEIRESKPKGKTILVVDDSATVRKLISSKLEKSGHQVICAVDGVEAMATIETMVPDLVLLDIAMPRMDGYQVCKLMRSNEALKDVPVVMISGKDGFFDKVRGRMAGTTGYITKPFGPETLMKALETYLIPETAAAE